MQEIKHDVDAQMQSLAQDTWLLGLGPRAIKIKKHVPAESEGRLTQVEHSITLRPILEHYATNSRPDKHYVLSLREPIRAMYTQSLM